MTTNGEQQCGLRGRQRDRLQLLGLLDTPPSALPLATVVDHGALLCACASAATDFRGSGMLTSPDPLRCTDPHRNPHPHLHRSKAAAD